MSRPPLVLLVPLLAALPIPPPVTGQSTGVIEGTLAVATGPQRKTASRYPTGTTAAKGMQEVRAVVYLSESLTGGDLADPGASGAGASAVGDASGDVAVGVAVDMVQRDTAFVPSTIAIRTGTVVRFPNADPFYHNVFSYAGIARFDLGRYPEGELREVTFGEPGIAQVYCEVHEYMRAVIVVTDHPFHAVVAEDGSFRLAGVPAGRYTLVAYHPDLGSLEQEVSVTGGQRVTLALALGGATPAGR